MEWSPGLWLTPSQIIFCRTRDRQEKNAVSIEHFFSDCQPKIDPACYWAAYEACFPDYLPVFLYSEKLTIGLFYLSSSWLVGVWLWTHAPQLSVQLLFSLDFLCWTLVWTFWHAVFGSQVWTVTEQSGLNGSSSHTIKTAAVDQSSCAQAWVMAVMKAKLQQIAVLVMVIAVSDSAKTQSPEGMASSTNFGGWSSCFCPNPVEC